MASNDKNKLITLGTLGDFKNLQEMTAVKLSITSLINLGASLAVTQSDNKEWKIVYTDAEDKVLFGITQDNNFKLYADIGDIIYLIMSQRQTT